MRRHGRTIFVVVVCNLFIYFTACQKQGPPVARINGKCTIELDELKEYIYKKNYRPQETRLSLSEATDLLNKLIERKVLALAAYQDKMDQDSSVLLQLELQTSTWMLQELYKRLNIDPFVKESDIRDYYSRMGKDVVIRTIFFALSPQSDPQQIKRVTEKADSILKKLKSGETFSDLARHFSEDKTTSSNGGLVGSLSWTRTDDPIRKVAFSLREGQYSGLIRNKQGIQIVYVEEILKKERESLGFLRDQIVNQLSNEHRIQISEKQAEIEKQISQKISIRWQESNLDTLVGYLTENKVYERNAFLFYLDSLLQKRKETVLATYNKEKFTISKLKEIAEKRLSLNYLGNISSKEGLKPMIERWLTTDELLDMAARKRLDRSRFVVEQRIQFIEKMAVERLIQREIWSKVNASPENIRAFYEQNKNQKYTEPERIQVQEILVEGEALANQIYVKAKNGVDFGNLAKEYTIRPAYKSKKGLLDEIQEGGGGILGDHGFGLKVGEISRPIAMGEGRYSVIKLLEKKKGITKTFDSVKETVFQDYINTKREEIRTAFISRKKKEFGGVQINNKILEQNFHEK